jgi:hypothetical protein
MPNINITPVHPKKKPYGRRTLPVSKKKKYQPPKYQENRKPMEKNNAPYK